MTAGALDEVEVSRLLGSMTRARFRTGARRITEVPMRPEERLLVEGALPKVRAATATGRMLARELLKSLGVRPDPILRGPHGEPLWPAGVYGSIAHDDDFCVCVVGDAIVGVDIEPLAPLPAELVNDIATTELERFLVVGDLIAARLLFCAKEAAYKALHSFYGEFLDHSQVTVNPGNFDRGVLHKPRGQLLLRGPSRGSGVHVELNREKVLLAVATANTEWEKEEQQEK